MHLCFKHASFENKAETDKLSDEEENYVPFPELAEILQKCGHVVPDEVEYAKIKIDNKISTSHSLYPKVAISEIVFQVNCAMCSKYH